MSTPKDHHGEEHSKKQIDAFIHDEARRRNILTAEYQPVLADADREPKAVRYPRGAGGLDHEKAARDPDLDPQPASGGLAQRNPPSAVRGDGVKPA